MNKYVKIVEETLNELNLELPNIGDPFFTKKDLKIVKKEVLEKAETYEQWYKWDHYITHRISYPSEVKVIYSVEVDTKNMFNDYVNEYIQMNDLDDDIKTLSKDKKLFASFMKTLKSLSKNNDWDIPYKLNLSDDENFVEDFVLDEIEVISYPSDRGDGESDLGELPSVEYKFSTMYDKRRNKLEVSSISNSKTKVLVHAYFDISYRDTLLV